MHSTSTLRQAVRTAAGLALAAMLLLSSGCGTDAGPIDDGPAPLPEDTYQEILGQGVDPALVYTIELPGFELAEQSAGVLGDSDYGAVYLPAEPPFTTEVYLEVTRGTYSEARCERDPLRGPSGGGPATVVQCEPDADGWYRTGGGWHEYVVSRAGHHLTVGAPSDAVDRNALTQAALGARRQDETSTSPAPRSSPADRGDLPTFGDGAPVDPHGASPPGGEGDRRASVTPCHGLDVQQPLTRHSRRSGLFGLALVEGFERCEGRVPRYGLAAERRRVEESEAACAASASRPIKSAGERPCLRMPRRSPGGGPERALAR